MKNFDKFQTRERLLDANDNKHMFPFPFPLYIYFIVFERSRIKTNVHDLLLEHEFSSTMEKACLQYSFTGTQREESFT